MKNVTRKDYHDIKLAASLLGSLAGTKVQFSTYNEVIIDGFVVAKLKITDNEPK